MSTILKSSLPSDPQLSFAAAVLIPPGAPRGYSIWKTGLSSSVKGLKVSHSLYCAHCSLTQKSTDGRTEEMMAPAFLRPMASLCLAASAERNLMKEVEWSSVRSRPFLFS